MSQYDRNEIEKRAYAIWEQEGCPHGKDEEHWTKAVAELEREASQRRKAKATVKKTDETQPPSKTGVQSRSAASARRNASEKPVPAKTVQKAAKKGEATEPKKTVTRRKS